VVGALALWQISTLALLRISKLRTKLSTVHQKQPNYILLSKEGQGQALSLQTPLIL